MKRWWEGIGLLVLAAVLLVGCGSSSDKGATESDDRTKSTETAEEDEMSVGDEADEGGEATAEDGSGPEVGVPGQNDSFDAGPDAKRLLLGSRGGTYYRLGTAFARHATENGTPLQPLVSPGSVENLYLVGLGYAEAAFVQANILTHDRYSVASQWVNVVRPLFLEEVHLLVRRDAGIDSVADLRGKKVALGGRASGTTPTSRAILMAAGINFRTEVDGIRTGPRESIKRLLRDQVDAVFLVGAGPLPDLRYIPAAKSEEIKLVPITEKVPDQSLQTATIEAGTYAWQSEPVKTLAVPCLLVVGERVAEENPAFVKALETEAAGGDHLAEAHPKGSQFGSVSWDGKLKSVDVKSIARKPEEPYIFFSAGRFGTYDVAARSIRAVMKHADIDVLPLNTQGSFRNLLLLASGNADFGIVQRDVVRQAARDYRFRSLLSNVRLVTPLFKEEIHLIVRRDADINELDDLKGKRVYTGMAASGTAFTANHMLDLLEIPVTRVRTTAPTALMMLVGSELDAFFYVGGQPVSLIESLPDAYREDIRLLDIKPVKGYEDATIPADAYAFADKETKTLATSAWLLAREEVPLEVVSELFKRLFAERKNLTKLHPKWQEFDYEVTRDTFKSRDTSIITHPGAFDALLETQVDSAPDRELHLGEQELPMTPGK